MVVKSVPTLPAYPSASTRKSLTPSQLSSLQSSILAALSSVLVVSGTIENSPLGASSLAFLQSYAQDHAFTTLQALIWDNLPVKSPTEKSIHIRALHLAQALADRGLLSDLKVLVDLAIVYARSRPSAFQKLFKAAVDSPQSGIFQDVKDSLIPSLTQILETGQGLYNQRKTAECIYCFALASNYSDSSSQSLLAPFAENTTFLTALARLYLTGLTSTARSYGGANAILSALNASSAPVDPTEWTSIYLSTKVTLLDSFHLLFKHMLSDLTSADGPRELTSRTEITFNALFAIMEVAQDTSSEPSAPPTPFLNFSLLQDYQQTHNLSSVLGHALKKAEERDARLDLLNSALSSVSSEPGPSGRKNPGALKLLLRGSGLQRHPNARGERPASYENFPDAAQAFSSTTSDPAALTQENDIELTSKASQVLDLLPDTPYEYVTKLLQSSRYGGNLESVIEALLDGSAPSEATLEKELAPLPTAVMEPAYERRNIFDDEVVDFDSVRFGKKKVESTPDLSDRFLREEMKADVLRRVEIMDLSDEETDDENIDPFALADAPTTTTTKKRVDASYEDDDLDVDDPAIRIPGADSDDESEIEIITSESQDADGGVKRVEAILELAYLSDPAVFGRDQATRRSKTRADLKTRTGWVDEQIEAWAIMLERDPKKKDKLLRKHEFRGNRALAMDEAGPSQPGQGQRGGGRGGRGGGRGGRGGRGRGGGGGEGGGGDRAYKDKNKASRGNHNRKRGHDKKMARAGGPS